MARVITEIFEQHRLSLDLVGDYVRIENAPYMPLSIEVIGPDLVAVAHYGVQNGYPMADPAMVYFSAFDADVGWVPLTFQNDYVGVYREGVSIVTGELLIIDAAELAGAAVFADTWATNIRAQGFAEVGKHGAIAVKRAGERGR